MAFPALADAEGKLADRQKKLHTIFDEAGPDLDMSLVKSVEGDSAAKVAAIKALNDEMGDLGREIDDLQKVAGIADAARKAREQNIPNPGAEGPTVPGPRQAESKSLGEHFTESKAFTGRQGQNGPEAHIDVELKTLMTTTAGWAPETFRTGRLVDFATRPIQVTDVIPQTTTGQAAVVYMEETTLTNNAAEVAEAGTYAESAFALTEQTNTVRKIGTFLPVTDEQLEDVPLVQGYLNNRLPFLVMQRLDSQILVGNGTAPNLRGILNVSGIQTQAKGADPVPDAIFKAMTLVRVTGRATPGPVIFHPTNWQSVRLMRTADGIYIWGSPSDTGPDRIWGSQVVQSDAITLGTAVLGDWQLYSELAMRRGLDVQVSNSHSTYFVEGKQAIRADIRAALVFYRPAAFATITGL
jgi:HK97 family phage major capsid protein